MKSKKLILILMSVGFVFAKNYEIPGLDMSVFNDIWQKKTHDYYSITLNGMFFEGTRPWHIRWELIKSATLFEGKRILDIGTSIGMCPLFISYYLNPAAVTALDSEENSVVAATRLQKLFGVSYNLLKLDLDKDSYEAVLGSNYDIVFCMSVLNWVKNKDRLLRYLSRFNELIFEGHDGTPGEIARLKSIGFKNFAILGYVDRDRHLIYCSK